MSVTRLRPIAALLTLVVASGLLAWWAMSPGVPPTAETPAIEAPSPSPSRTAEARPRAPRSPVPGAAAAGVAPRPPPPGTVVPTWEEVEEAYATFEDMPLRPLVAPAAGERFDLEVSQRLHEKTLAFRSLALMLGAGVAGDAFGQADADAMIADARAHMAEELADIPVPSYVEDPDDIVAYRARMAERALAVLDEAADPSDVNAGRAAEENE